MKNTFNVDYNVAQINV